MTLNFDYALFLDDERFPTDLPIAQSKPIDKWRIARNMFDAKWLITNLGVPYYISFDHDLGSPKNDSGMDFAKWLADHIINNQIDLNGFTFYVHSMNPVGKQNIQQYMDQFIKLYNAGDII